MKSIPILQVGDVLLAGDILTERFCCDYDVCRGICCIEGDAGAPVSLDEIAEIEDVVDDVWNNLSAQAQAVIDRQGVAYCDQEGDMVTSIVGGKDCVFTCYSHSMNGEDGAEKDKDNDGKAADERPYCLCALEKAYREGRTKFCKPISCSLYPIREKRFANGLVGLNYHRWDVCRDAIKKGKELNMPLYKFLKGPLTKRFGKEWYDELCQVAAELAADD